MIENLDEDSRKELVNYRIERAFLALKEADYNANGQF